MAEPLREGADRGRHLHGHITVESVDGPGPTMPQLQRLFGAVESGLLELTWTDDDGTEYHSSAPLNVSS